METAMSETSQTRALKNYRKRLNQRGMARFEVLGLDADRELIRSMARKLADNSPEAQELRASIHRRIAAEPPKKGGILAALRGSPLVGADLNVARPRIDARRVDL
jgi:transposase